MNTQNDLAELRQAIEPQAGPGPTVEELRALGYSLLPLPPKAKEPPPKGWKEHAEPYEIPAEDNVAVAVGERSHGLAVLITNDDASTTWATEKFGPPTVRSRRGGHWWFKAPSGTANEANAKTDVGQMELHAAHGKYVVIPPSIHPSGVPYTWSGGPTSNLPALPDLRDLWHPGGTHHTELLRQSAAKAHDGKDAETIFRELTSWRNAHLPDPHAHPDRELRQLAESAVAKFQSERPPADSAALFRDLVEAWKVHAYLPDEWEYRVLALFSLQSRLAPRLPRVFYLFMAGTKGSGKTTILDHISEVCRALRFQNVSLPTLARAMGERPAPTVAIDEYDTTTGDRGTDEARNALVRQGYKANAAPFKRSEVSGGKVVPVEFPIYGPKALTFHRGVEDALQDRGFILPTEKGKNYAYVVRAISPKWADLIPRLDAWGEVARSNLNPARLLERVEAQDFQSKVGRVLGTLGASRNAELVTVAVLVAEAAGVDLEVELRDALAAKEREATENEWVGVLADLLPSLARSAPKLEDAPFYVVKQSEVKAELDKARKERHLPPCSAAEFAGLRRDLGVRSGWTRTRGKVKYWHMPEAFVLDLESQGDGPLTPLAPLSSREVKGGQGGQGGLAGRDPEDLLGPGPTRSDRALANARREGSLAPDPPLKKETEKRWPTDLGCRW